MQGICPYYPLRKAARVWSEPELKIARKVVGTPTAWRGDMHVEFMLTGDYLMGEFMKRPEAQVLRRTHAKIRRHEVSRYPEAACLKSRLEGEGHTGTKAKPFAADDTILVEKIEKLRALGDRDRRDYLRKQYWR